MNNAEANQAGTISGQSGGIRKKVTRLVGGLIVGFAVAYTIAAGYMYLNQRSFIFVPSGELATPLEKGLENVSVENVQMADGTSVVVWSAEAVEPGAPTVLYFHGNSGNLSTRWKRFKQILDSGYGLYAPGYRGYAGSEGSPSEAALVADALEHFDRLADSGAEIIVHGESLGSGVATAVAAQRADAGLLVLEAPYTALVDMASAQYPWLPVDFLMKDKMLTRERLPSVTAPVLILHGTEDWVIPVEHGRRLFEIANDPKELVIVEGIGHSDLWKNGLWTAVQDLWAKGR
ncbi:MAG: alpha/beta fold hydrolase [Roseibium sp.]|uniref:alpha/beta hydrolase n=1 Tax=Roseibium sp. TaxID=1936156 RepID=UPI001B1F8D00|nr:alpha/beta hydrolase [Roseibium sp.]MBO6890602.1 alpha/beta fold hydrolase [Roseibium sp.]MBO6932398.1 alpha/beta fold hydrolase [Roseibium sp.]